MRIKRGTTRQRSHKKVLDLTKGYRMSYGRLFKRSQEAALHAGEYSFNHRRARRSQMKGTWLNAINAGLSQENISYSKFVNKLHTAGCELNSKSLASLAIEYPNDFASLVKQFAS